MICVNVVHGSYIRQVFIVDAQTCEDAITVLKMANRLIKEENKTPLFSDDCKLMAEPVSFKNQTPEGRVYQAY